MTKISVNQLLRKADNFVKKNNLEKAFAIYNEVLKQFPKNQEAKVKLRQLASGGSRSPEGELPESVLNQLVALYEKGEYKSLVNQCSNLQSSFPGSLILFKLKGVSQRFLGLNSDATQSYRKALEISPYDIETHHNLSIVLNQNGETKESIHLLENLISSNIANDSTYNFLGNSYKQIGKIDKAILYYNKALSLNPKNADVCNNLGILYQALNKSNDSVNAYKKAISINPNFFQAFFNLGNVFLHDGNYLESENYFRRALTINSNFYQAHNSLGIALKNQGKYKLAIESYQKALKIYPNYPECLNNLGVIYQEAGDHQNSVIYFERSLDLRKNNTETLSQYFLEKMQICDWNDNKGYIQALADVAISQQQLPPFSMLGFEDNPQNQLIRSQVWASSKYGKQTLREYTKHNGKKIKLGYFGSDFYNHATMYLMSGLFRNHNIDDFEIYIYDYGYEKFGYLRDELNLKFNNIFNIENISDYQIASLCYEHKLDIAIDLKGYTTGNRLNIFRYRIAPIQISYLGYPGSIGAEFIDYILADPVLISKDVRQFYSEKILYMPYCYQPNDNQRNISSNITKRRDHGLPDNAFVFCCFNNNYKITSVELDIWARLLKKVQDSVLWILRSNLIAEKNLLNEFSNRDIDPNKIIFADKIQHEHHLERHRHADLFLDTFNINAHTTASDALWAGLPMVTVLGRQFASRVGASLLFACGLDELVTKTLKDYEELCIELATDKSRLMKIKNKILTSKASLPLFDTVTYTKDFEILLYKAHKRFIQGKNPVDLCLNNN